MIKPQVIRSLCIFLAIFAIIGASYAVSGIVFGIIVGVWVFVAQIASTWCAETLAQLEAKNSRKR